MMIFSRHPDHNRLISVTDIPDGDPMVIQVRYLGDGSAHKGVALDSHIMPLLHAAAELLVACKAVLARFDLEPDDRHFPASGFKEFLRETIARAEGRAR